MRKNMIFLISAWLCITLMSCSGDDEQEVSYFSFEQPDEIVTNDIYLDINNMPNDRMLTLDELPMWIAKFVLEIDGLYYFGSPACSVYLHDYNGKTIIRLEGRLQNELYGYIYYNDGSKVEDSFRSYEEYIRAMSTIPKEEWKQVFHSSDIDYAGGEAITVQTNSYISGRQKFKSGMSTDGMPSCLIQWIRGQETKSNRSFYYILRGRWRGETLYFIMGQKTKTYESDILNHVYRSNGENVKWLQVADLRDFLKSSSEWSLRYVIDID